VGAHTHDAHTTASKGGGSTAHLTGTDATSGTTTHTSVGGHTHNAHSAHSGSTIDAHTSLITAAGGHSGNTHSVTNPNDHTTPGHTGGTVTGAHTHTGMALQSDSTATSTANPPFQVSIFVVKT
jgi:hypothetical protein